MAACEGKLQKGAGKPWQKQQAAWELSLCDLLQSCQERDILEWLLSSSDRNAFWLLLERLNSENMHFNFQQRQTVLICEGFLKTALFQRADDECLQTSLVVSSVHTSVSPLPGMDSYQRFQSYISARN